MKRILLLIVLLSAGVAMVEARRPRIYQLKVKDADGKEVSLKQYKGHVMIIVNTATRCGFTPQYADLEQLYEEFHQQGLEVLDFPCNQFGGQAPEDIREITAFCTGTYGTRFAQFDKVEVNGLGADSLFVYLKSQQPFHGFGDSQRGQMMHKMLKNADPDYEKSPDIKWNFTKFLVDKKGRVVARFEPTDDMKAVADAIRRLL
ncbi:MAG: glutathione peroxidase [Prevotella sp.]|nr:glutathione peroxidase [Prevotella sp.]